MGNFFTTPSQPCPIQEILSLCESNCLLFTVIFETGEINAHRQFNIFGFVFLNHLPAPQHVPGGNGQPLNLHGRDLVLAQFHEIFREEVDDLITTNPQVFDWIYESGWMTGFFKTIDQAFLGGTEENPTPPATLVANGFAVIEGAKLILRQLYGQDFI